MSDATAGVEAAVASVVDVLKRYLEESSIAFVQHDPTHVELMVGSPGPKPYPERILIHAKSDNRSFLQVYAGNVMRVPLACRRQVAELIMAANWNMVTGCFEMDPRDGEVRFRASQALRSTDDSDGHDARMCVDFSWQKIISTASMSFHVFLCALGEQLKDQAAFAALPVNEVREIGKIIAHFIRQSAIDSTGEEEEEAAEGEAEHEALPPVEEGHAQIPEVD